MRPEEKRFYSDQEKVEEFLREVNLNKSSEDVEYMEDENYRIVRIKKGGSSITRKVHTVPEYFEKNGD